MYKMNQYFIESKHIIFFSFNRIIPNHENDLGFQLLIHQFQENFEKEKQENWLKFWNNQGEDLVLKTWNKKYKNYLKEDQTSENNKLTDATEQLETAEVHDTSHLEKEQDYETKEQTARSIQVEPNISKTLVEETREVNDVLHEISWQGLWQENIKEIYCEQYLIFSTIYYNYFLDLKKSCETTQTIFEDNEEIEEDDCSERENLAQELEQLKILGLPTSFTGRLHNSSKKYSKSKKSTIHYSDFFSDSEMENDSDLEDYREVNVTADHLHNVKQKKSRKIQKLKRNRQLKNVPSFILEEKGLLKYWRKRFSLFSRFDEGIRLDRESWFSVTPEKVAKHLAKRLKCGIITDGFCGSGGNAIQFAFTCDKVIAIDIDPVKLEMAKHNAKIYKVSHKIEFILGDFLHLAASGKLKTDIVFLSPPWGGPKYKNIKEFDIEKYLLPIKASELVLASKKISDNIALFLPRNSSVKQIVKLAGIGNRCEIEHNYLDSRLVAITALYGEEILSKQSENETH